MSAVTGRALCVQCQVPFEINQRGRPRKFCSADCRKQNEASRDCRPPRKSYTRRPEVCRVEGCERQVAAVGLCSKHYARLRAWGQTDKPERPCIHCGKPTTKTKYCSPCCSWTARDRLKGVRPLVEVKAERRAAAERECQRCGVKFVKSGGGNPGKFCSKRCASSRKRGPKPSPSWVRDCAMYRRWAERIASDVEAERRKEARAVKAARAALLGAIICFVRNPKRQCVECGDPIGHYHAKRSLCNSCGKAKAQASKRASRTAGKARLRAATVDMFDPIEILERDNWRCHMCGCQTPKRLRGTFKDNAPEVDHLIPLAAGGEHSRRNVACACRKCNIAKADRPMGQLRLIA